MKTATNFENDLAALAATVFNQGYTVGVLRRRADAIGLAYGLLGIEVLRLALAAGATATGKAKDATLRHYPVWCRQPGATFEHKH